MTRVPRPPAPTTPREIESEGAAASIAPPLTKQKDRLFILSSTLKQKLQTKRQNATRSGSIYRAEAPGRIATGIEPDGCANTRKVRVIENVERLGPEL